MLIDGHFYHKIHIFISKFNYFYIFNINLYDDETFQNHLGNFIRYSKNHYNLDRLCDKFLRL
jgi:hypothetical protein